MPAAEHPAEPVLMRYFTYRLNTLSKLNNLASQAMYRAACGLSLAETRCLAAEVGPRRSPRPSRGSARSSPTGSSPRSAAWSSRTAPSSRSRSRSCRSS